MLAAAVLALLGAAPAQLAPPRLGLPVACSLERDCFIQHHVDNDAGTGARDYRCGLQTYHTHNGVDIRVPRRSPRAAAVLAAARGKVAWLRDGVEDISARVRPSTPGQECGNGVVIDHGGGWESQYCHVARRSVAVREGQTVAAGQAIARVGLSGNTEYPHLHFTLRLHGRAVDPFAWDSPPGQCGTGRSAWRSTPPYRAGQILEAGFASAPVTLRDGEVQVAAAPPRRSTPLIAYAMAIGLMPGDVVRLALHAPDGRVIARHDAEPLAQWRAQDLVFVGVEPGTRPRAAGVYRAHYVVERAGRVALARELRVALR